MMKNRGKGQNPGILIKYAITVRKKKPHQGVFQAAE